MTEDEKTEVVMRWEYVDCNWIQVPEERSTELSHRERMEEGDC